MAYHNDPLYQDTERTVRRDGGTLTITGKRGEKKVRLPAEFDTPDAKTQAAIRAQGYDPAGWFLLVIPRQKTRHGTCGGAPLAACPPELRPAIEQALRDYAAELQAAHNAYWGNPANVERDRIEKLYAEAERHEDYPGDYYRILADADAALKAWRAQYPNAARKERAANLRLEADHEDDLAVGALVYDADGWISPAEQEKRSAEFKAKAAALRQQAADLEAEVAP